MKMQVFVEEKFVPLPCRRTADELNAVFFYNILRYDYLTMISNNAILALSIFFAVYYIQGEEKWTLLQ